MTWISVDSPPPLLDVEWWEGKRASEPVLCVLSNGRQLVATFEGFEDETARWFTNCSEHWQIGNDLVAWQRLPPPPNGPVSKA